jgi:hypothetical protein
MRSGGRRFRPGLLSLEARLPLADAGTGSTKLPAEQPILVGPKINPVLSAFAKAYLTVVGNPNYNSAVDINNNGIVGMEDALPILHALASITPRVPLTLFLRLAGSQQANTPHPANSGGVTRVPKSQPLMIVGHTTPNSLVFTDDANNDMRFKGGVAIPVDSSGNFAITINITSPYRISQHDFLVIDPFGHRLKRAFPILQLPS